MYCCDTRGLTRVKYKHKHTPLSEKRTQKQRTVLISQITHQQQPDEAKKKGKKKTHGMKSKSFNSPLSLSPLSLCPFSQLLPECRLDYSPLRPLVRLTPLFIG